MTNKSNNQEALIGLLAKQVATKTPGAMLYKGHTRLYCPHLLAKTKDGKMVVHAFQFGGSGSKGPIAPDKGEWRYFYLDEIEKAVDGPVSTWYPEVQETLEKKERKLPAFISEVFAVVKD